MITNTPKFLDRILTFRGRGDFADLGLSAQLINALDDKDLEEIISYNVYFNVLYSPSSTANIAFALPSDSTIISIDVNSIAKWSVDERVAIVLHELRHIL